MAPRLPSLFIFIVFFTLSGTLLAETNPIGIPLVSFIPTKEIGGTGECRGIAEDSRGRIYIASKNLIHFSQGEGWRTSQSYGQRWISRIVVDGDDRLIAGSNADTGYIDMSGPNEGPWVSILKDLPPLPPRYLWNPVGYDRTLNRTFFSCGHMLTAWRPDAPNMIWKDASSVIEIYRLNSRLFGINDKNNYIELHPDGTLSPVANNPTDNATLSACVLENNQLLIVTEKGTFWLFDGNTFKPWELQNPHLEPDNLPAKIFALSDGRIAIHTQQNSTLIADYSGKILNRYRQINAALRMLIHRGHVDKDGGLWLASGTGLYRMSTDDTATYFGASQGIEGTVNGVAIYNDHLYVWTNIGFFRARPGHTGAAFECLFNSGPVHRAVFTPLGPVIGTTKGMLHIRENQPPVVLEAGLRYHILQDRNDPGILYASSLRGLIKITAQADGTWQILEGQNALAASNLQNITQDPMGRVWFTLKRGEIRSWHPQEGVIVHAEQSGLPPDQAYEAFTINGNLVVVGNSRNIWLPDTPEAKRFTRAPKWSFVTGDDYRITGYTRGIVDADGQTYIQNCHHSNVFTTAPSNAHRRNLAWLQQSANADATLARFTDPLGQHWFGNAAGLVCLPPDAELTKKPAKITPVQLTGITNLKTNQPLSFSNETRAFTYDQRSLRFEFAKADFRTYGLNTYSIQLQGFDPQPSPFSRQTHRDYTNLPPGKYTLLIEARDFFGTPATPATFAFTIAAPFYLSPLGLTLITLGTLSLIAGAVSFRQRQLRLRNTELSRQVEARTAELAQAVAQAKELAVKAQDASRAKGQFLANMSHEIRTPMNGVMGMSTLLSETPLNETQKDYVRTIRSSSEALLTIINDILDFSKVEAGKLQLEHNSFDLRECVEDVLELLAPAAHHKHVELIGIIDPSLSPHRISDSSRIRQILVNLMGNAVKFTEQGEVVLTIKPSPDPQKLIFEITDTGIGIPPEKLKNLFQPFAQADNSTSRKYGGTGLGLAISRQLSRLMGGDIIATSEPGKGSTFTTTLQAPVDPNPIETRAAVSSLSNHTVLIVDDNATNRRHLKDLAECWKMRPVIASHTLEANTLLAAHQPDLVWLDYNMPDQDGLEWVGEIRKNPAHQKLPILLLTSSTHNEAIRAFTEQPLSASLTKPIRQNQLARLTSRLLGLDTFHSGQTRAPLQTSTFTAAPLRVLLAEDNAVNQKVAALMLKKVGLSPDLAGNGLEAIAALQRQTYDLVLMDLHMPECDGLEATRRIRAEFPPDQQPRIIALTAAALAADREACSEAGMDDFLSKPIRQPDLLKAIEETSNMISQRHANSHKPPPP